MATIYFILAILLSLVILLLFAPISLIINYDSGLEVKIKILGIKLKVFGKNIKAKTAEKNPNPSKQGKKEKDLNENLQTALQALKSSKDALTEIFKKITIKDLVFRLKVADKDASKTAISYGQASGIVYSIFSLINSIKPATEYDVLVLPDFLSEKSSVFLNFEISLKLFSLLLSTVKYAKKISEILKS